MKAKKIHSINQVYFLGQICDTFNQETVEGVIVKAESHGLSDVHYHDIGGDEMLLGMLNETTMVVVFMSSEASFHDWFSNLNFTSIESGWGWRCHRGFLETAFGFEDLVMSYRRKQGLKEITILFSGHSRGAGQSNFLANHLAEEQMKDDNIELITFGSPRVFKASAIKKLKVKKVTRVVNNGDRVTTYPPAILRFRHYGQELHLPGPWWKRLPLVSIGASHFLNYYLDKIKALR